MLRKVQRKKVSGGGLRIAVVGAAYNEKYTDALVNTALKTLKENGVKNVPVFRVPGSFEVTCVAGELSRARKRWDAVICFGVIFRGQTTHAQQIADAVSLGLTTIQSATGVPMIHGVYLFEDEEQARIRCLGTEHNRGVEAGLTALQMAQTMRSVRQVSPVR